MLASRMIDMTWSQYKRHFSFFDCSASNLGEVTDLAAFDVIVLGALVVGLSTHIRNSEAENSYQS